MAESFLAVDKLHSFNRTPQQGISTLAKILSRGSIILTPISMITCRYLVILGLYGS